MDRLGHLTAEAAMRYQHVARGRDAEIAAKLSQLAGHEPGVSISNGDATTQAAPGRRPNR